MTKPGILQIAIFITALLVQTASGQETNKHYCGLFIGNEKKDKPIAEINFEAPIGQWKETVKSLRIPATIYFLIVQVTYSESNRVTDLTPQSTILEMRVSSVPKMKGGKELIYSSSETKFDVEETSFLQLSHRIKGQAYHYGLQCSKKQCEFQKYVAVRRVE